MGAVVRAPAGDRPAHDRWSSQPPAGGVAKRRSDVRATPPLAALGPRTARGQGAAAKAPRRRCRAWRRSGGPRFTHGACSPPAARVISRSHAAQPCLGHPAALLPAPRVGRTPPEAASPSPCPGRSETVRERAVVEEPGGQRRVPARQQGSGRQPFEERIPTAGRRSSGDRDGGVIRKHGRTPEGFPAQTQSLPQSIDLASHLC